MQKLPDVADFLPVVQKVGGGAEPVRDALVEQVRPVFQEGVQVRHVVRDVRGGDRVRGDRNMVAIAPDLGDLPKPQLFIQQQDPVLALDFSVAV